MTEFQKRLEANIRESLRFAVGEVQDDAVAHMIAGVNAVLNHPCAPAPSEHLEVVEALRAAEPYVEICHSLISKKDTRAQVWKVLKQIRAALATTEGKP